MSTNPLSAERSTRVSPERARTKVRTISIVGLGYVGLPLSILAAERGYKVIGFDIDRSR